jgi:hypothetical protein
MALRINIEASIRRKRIIRKFITSGERLAFILFEIPLRAFVVLIWLFMFGMAAKGGNSSIGSNMLIACTFILAATITVGMLLTGVLVEVGEIRGEGDRVFLEQVLQKGHPGFGWRAEQRLSINVKKSWLFDDRLVVIERDEKTYVNFAILGRADTVLFFFGIFNYYRGWQIRRRFQKFLTSPA